MNLNLLKKYQRFLIPLCVGVFITGVLLIYHKIYIDSTLRDIQSYLKEIYRIERDFVTGIPVYDDFATQDKESALRRHLLMDHIRASVQCGLAPIRSDGEIEILAQRGEMTRLKSSLDDLYYFFNVSEKYRYLRPHAVRGLQELARRFQENLNKRKELPPVKFAVSSAVRPLSYQSDLMKRNINAEFVSSHSYGTSFDIFYDEYYIVLPHTGPSNMLSGKLLKLIRRRSGFMLGGYLKSQLRAILMETLIQLQEEGLLYAIYEKRQRCYHVTVLKM